MPNPPTVTLPSVGGMKPVIMRIVVDLPAPFGPRKPSTSPRSTENETPSTARLAPKTFTKFSTLIISRVRIRPERAVEIVVRRAKCKLVFATLSLGAGCFTIPHRFALLTIYYDNVQFFFRLRRPTDLPRVDFSVAGPGRMPD